MTSIADLEKDVQRAKENLAHAERLLAEEKEGFKFTDARDHYIRVTYLDKHQQLYVSVADDDGMLKTIVLDSEKTCQLYRYLSRRLGFSL